jgi:hypothetical protein
MRCYHAPQVHGRFIGSMEWASDLFFENYHASGYLSLFLGGLDMGEDRSPGCDQGGNHTDKSYENA